MKISGEGRVKESITRTRRAPSVATVGSICDLNLKIPGKHCPCARNQNFHLGGVGVPGAVEVGTSALVGHPHVNRVRGGDTGGVAFLVKNKHDQQMEK